MEGNSNQISEPFAPSIETLLTELRKVIDGIPPDVFASITQRNWIVESLDLKDK
jgi:actin-like ATPase involved in cell morphogenesis